MTAASVVRLVDIRETPLRVEEVLEELADVSAGGLTLFVGTVRDHDGGKEVGGLDYSAHPTALVGSSRVDLQACKLEYSIVSPK